MTSPEPTTSPASAPARRLALRFALGLLGLIAIGRAVLPVAVEALIESEGSAALGVEVEVDDVDLALLRGALAIEGLRVAGIASENHTPTEDLLRLERAEARISWAPTVAGTPTLANIELVSPRIRMRRLEDGSLDVEGLAGSETAPEPATESASEPLAIEIASLRVSGFDLALVDEGADTDAPLRLAIDSIALDGALIEGDGFTLAGFDLATAHIDLAPIIDLQLAIDTHSSNVSLQEAHRFPVEVNVVFPKVETTDGAPPPAAALAGELGLTPLAFEGRFETRDVPLPILARAADVAPWSNWLSAGQLDTDLSLRVTSDDEENRSAAVSGRIAVDGLSAENSPEEEAREIALAWKQLEIDLREASVQVDSEGMLLGSPLVRLAGITLQEPDILFTHGGSALAADPGEGEGDTASEDESSPTPEIQLDFVQIVDGRFAFADHTTEPRFREEFEDIDFEAARIDPSSGSVKKIDLRLSNRDAMLAVKGGVGDGRSLAIDLEDLALAPFNAYALSLAGYVVERGKLSVHSKIEQSGGGLSAENEVTFDDLAVEEAGDGGFEEQFGMSLAMALALLRDHEGKIALDVPIEQQGEETDIGLREIALDAMRTAFVGALTSPLKLVTAVVPGGDEEVGEPVVVFEAKSREAPEGASQQLEPIVNLLLQRPTLAVSLRGQVGPDDGKAEDTDLDALAGARAERIRTLLIEQLAVAEGQIVIDPQVPVGTPGVALALVPRPAPEAPEPTPASP